MDYFCRKNDSKKNKKTTKISKSLFYINNQDYHHKKSYSTEYY